MLTPDRLKEIHQAATTPIRGRLPEDIFVNYFLPYFASRQDTYPNAEKVYSDWISVAGHPYNEVDILDTTGRAIFSVPAMMNTATFNPKNDSDIKYADLVATAEAYRAMSDIHANNFMEEALTVKFREVFQPSDKIFTSEQRWFAIFRRYVDLLPEDLKAVVSGTPKTDAVQETAAQAAKLDDEMSF